MPGSTAVNCPVEKSPLTIHRKPHLHPCRPLQTRKRVKKSNLPLAGVSRRSGGAVDRVRRSGPETPLLRWKFDDAELSGKPPPETGVKSRRKAKNRSGKAVPTVSARKLAVGIWHLQLMEAARSEGGVREATGASLGFQHHHGNLRLSRACNGDNADLHLGLKNGFSSFIPLHKKVSAAIPNSAMERSTKWDSGRTSEDVFEIFNQLKLFEDQQISTASIVSSLRVELESAQSRIYELEAERKSSKKKLDNFLRKLAEEKASWRTREHEKVRAIIDSMKSDLRRERKNRQRVEIVNSKLVNELAEAKLSSKRLLQDYDKERRARELMEEVCDELAKEIGEDKAEVETLKRESMKIREEVEEERKMLQMAEVWREERVQMKLLDAKLALEDKYSKLSKLEDELEAFLRAAGRSSDISEVRQAVLLKEAVDLVKIEKSNDFTYQPPPASEDLFAVFEELRPKEETNERDIEPCNGYSPATHESNILSVSPATDVFLEKPTRRCSNVDTEDDSDWETLSPGEEQGLSDSLRGSEPSVNAMCEESNASVTGTDRERNEGNGEVNSEFYTLTATQPKKKGTSITRLWRSSCPNNGEINKKNSTELLNGRLSDGRMSNLAPSPDCGLREVELSLPRIDQWSSPDSASPHITHGMKGCIEWPRGSHKQSLKAKLLEARIESQKTQLRHILKQKI